MYFLENDSPFDTARRFFNQQRVLCDCIMAEVADADVRIRSLAEFYGRGRQTAIASIDVLSAPWNSIQNFREYHLNCTPSKNKAKFVAIMNLLIGNAAIKRVGSDLLTVINTVVTKALTYVGAFEASWPLSYFRTASQKDSTIINDGLSLSEDNLSYGALNRKRRQPTQLANVYHPIPRPNSHGNITDVHLIAMDGTQPPVLRGESALTTSFHDCISKDKGYLNNQSNPRDSYDDISHNTISSTTSASDQTHSDRASTNGSPSVDIDILPHDIHWDYFVHDFSHDLERDDSSESDSVPQTAANLSMQPVFTPCPALSISSYPVSQNMLMSACLLYYPAHSFVTVPHMISHFPQRQMKQSHPNQSLAPFSNSSSLIPSISLSLFSEEVSSSSSLLPFQRQRGSPYEISSTSENA